MGRRHEQTFQMATKKMKRCSTSLDIRALQFEITVRCDHTPTPIGIARIRKSDNDCTRCWPGKVGKLDLSDIAGGKVKWTNSGSPRCPG